MKKERLKSALGWYALAGALVILDQVVKGLVRATMTLGQTRPFIPLVELYYVENTGGAFSIFNDYTWILTVLSALVTVGLVLCIWKGKLADNALSRLCLALVLAGAAGNLIDRAVFGQVTDMFNFTFMKFGVFNVADICVVGGVIGYAGYTLFAQFKEDHSHEADPDSPQ